MGVEYMYIYACARHSIYYDINYTFNLVRHTHLSGRILTLSSWVQVPR